MKIIAKFNEDVSWVTGPHVIVQKDKDLPNLGRETSSYLWWIIQNYENLPDTMHFLQANPFDHVNENLETKWWADSDKEGNPHHPGLLIEPLANELGINLPEGFWLFPAGACFKVTRDEVLKYPKEWYEKAFKLSNEYPQAPWIFERLWKLIYDNLE